MSEAAFLALTGPVLWHLTPQANLTGINRMGLLRTSSLIAYAEEDPTKWYLRPESTSLRLEAGLRAMLGSRGALAAAQGKDFLEGHTVESWAAQADRRLYFWPTADRPEAPNMAAIAIDAAQLYRVFANETDISPIDTLSGGNEPARRGDWIYMPSARADEFPGARMARGLVTAPDRVVEVSLRGDLTPARLAMVLHEPLPKAP